MQSAIFIALIVLELWRGNPPHSRPEKTPGLDKVNPVS